MFQPSSVVDVGCGPGHALSYFAEQGVAIFGLDISDESARRFAPEVVRAHLHSVDVTCWLRDWRYQRFDLAICWHLGEHVHQRHACNLVEGLTRLAGRIHWSAAPPGQNGVHHINCKPPDWWAERFAQFGYLVNRDATNCWQHSMEAKYGSGRLGRSIRENALLLEPLIHETVP